MSHVIRILLGALIGAVAIWASVSFYGLLAAWSPWSTEWWKRHMDVVVFGSELIAVLPCVLGLGVAFDKLYRARPALCALASMTIALLVNFADTLRTPELIAPIVRLTWQLFLPFLLGPPLLVYLIGALRSNKRLERAGGG